MIMKVEPIFLGVREIISKTKSIKPKERKIILLSPRGEKFDQKLALRLSKLKQIVFVCGHYEGVDERVAKYIADKVVSIGDYVLTGGELPSMVMIDAITRLVPKVIKEESLREESFSLLDSGFKVQREYPQYTRPAIFDPKKFIKNPKKYPSRFFRAKLWRVPKVLLSGNHQKIREWRKKHVL
jgi:tRNA (guanine37-N1)-methyltransferase